MIKRSINCPRCDSEIKLVYNNKAGYGYVAVCGCGLQRDGYGRFKLKLDDFTISFRSDEKTEINWTEEVIRHEVDLEATSKVLEAKFGDDVQSQLQNGTITRAQVQACRVYHDVPRKETKMLEMDGHRWNITTDQIQLLRMME